MSNSAYKRHYKLILENKGYHKCDLCMKYFTNTTSLRSHFQNIHEKLGNNHKCDFCEKMFPSISNSNRHKIQMHQNN